MNYKNRYLFVTAVLAVSCAPSSIMAQTPINTLTVNLKSYGVVGNGVTDDSVSIQQTINAVAAAGGGTIQVPTGNYSHSATINRPRNVVIQGSGIGSTYFTYTGSTVAWILGDTVTTSPMDSIHRGGLRDLTIYGPGFTGNVLGIELGGDPNGVLSPSSMFDDNEEWHNVMITNFGIGAKPGNNTYLGYFEGVNFLNNGRHWVDTGGYNSGERMTFVGSEFVQSKSSTASAVELDNNLADYYFEGISSDYNNTSQPDFSCASGTMHAAFNHAHFEKLHGSYFAVNTNICIANLSIDNSEFSTTGEGITDPYMIGLISGYGGHVYVSVRDTQINSNEPLTQFIDAANSNHTVTLDTLQWENYNSNLLSVINDHGRPAGIVGINTAGVP